MKNFQSLTFTLAGVWQPIADSYISPSNHGLPVGPFTSSVRVGAQQVPGIIMTGWSFAGSSPFDDVSKPTTPVSVALLALGPDGAMHLATSQYLPSDLTNGGGSVNVADFNGDGRDDIFLAAHNESPFVEKPSTVYLSNAAGSFTKMTLPDAVMAHDAQLAYIDGVPTIYSKTFNHNATNPYYVYDAAQNAFVIRDLTNGGPSLGGMSLAPADFDNDGKLDIAVGDFGFGPGYEYSPTNKTKIGIYRLVDGALGPAPVAVLNQYFPAHPEIDFVSHFGPGNSHTYRLKADDFNHDGLMDLLGLESLWVPGPVAYPNTIQMLQNGGNFSFADVSDDLNASFPKDTDELDYSFQLVDLDGSGINSYLSATSPGPLGNARQANFLIVNDGTGHLHVALHDEFVAMAPRINAYINTFYNDPSTLLVPAESTATPRFVPYVVDGKVNYVAVVTALKQLDGYYQNKLVLVDVPLAYDVTTDFTQAIAIDDRNGSRLMRTFAGDDVVRDSNAAATAHIDGGAGTDRAIYSLARAQYQLNKSADGVTVTGVAISDTLVNFEYLQFADGEVSFDIAGYAGQAYRLYKAAFDRVPDVGGLGYQINDMNHYGLHVVAGNFLASPEFQRTYGATDNTQFITLLYHNVLDREPDAGGLQWHLDELAHGFTRADVLIAFSESPENQANVMGQIEDGIFYVPFS